MNKAQISWYVKCLSDERYSVNDNFYAGKYTDDDPIVVDIQLWNNRWGTENVQDLTDYDICFFFDCVEDSVLLDYCTVIYDNSNIIPFYVTGRKAVLSMDIKPTLSGSKNNGSSKDNPDHFLQLRLTFQADNERLKNNDIKSLYFEVLER